VRGLNPSKLEEVSRASTNIARGRAEGAASRTSSVLSITYYKYMLDEEILQFLSIDCRYRVDGDFLNSVFMDQIDIIVVRRKLRLAPRSPEVIRKL
jgi:hypothetical protein